MDEPVILPSAHRHGIADEDIAHALEFSIRDFAEQGMWQLLMVIGPDRSGRLLEVGVDPLPEGYVVVHAMTARRKYLRPTQEE